MTGRIKLRILSTVVLAAPLGFMRPAGGHHESRFQSLSKNVLAPMGLFSKMLAPHGVVLAGKDEFETELDERSIRRRVLGVRLTPKPLELETIEVDPNRLLAKIGSKSRLAKLWAPQMQMKKCIFPDLYSIDTGVAYLPTLIEPAQIQTIFLVIGQHIAQPDFSRWETASVNTHAFQTVTGPPLSVGLSPTGICSYPRCTRSVRARLRITALTKDEWRRGGHQDRGAERGEEESTGSRPG